MVGALSHVRENLLRVYAIQYESYGTRLPESINPPPSRTPPYASAFSRLRSLRPRRRACAPSLDAAEIFRGQRRLSALRLDGQKPHPPWPLCARQQRRPPLHTDPPARLPALPRCLLPPFRRRKLLCARLRSGGARPRRLRSRCALRLAHHAPHGCRASHTLARVPLSIHGHFLRIPAHRNPYAVLHRAHPLGRRPLSGSRRLAVGPRVHVCRDVGRAPPARRRAGRHRVRSAYGDDVCRSSFRQTPAALQCRSPAKAPRLPPPRPRPFRRVDIPQLARLPRPPAARSALRHRSRRADMAWLSALDQNLVPRFRINLSGLLEYAGRDRRRRQP